MPSMVHKSPLANLTKLVGLSLASGQFLRTSNLRVTPNESEMIRMSWNLPWNRRSSSECHPTDMPPFSYKFKLQQFGQSWRLCMPQFGITCSMICSIQGGNDSG
eukprot:CAMPEP_0194749316 /NCGR_PEP_ID=MMETSP0323_2-20130528/3531_1 /TAXON_ID=2866 ORGANISM="Crypthecodinium cohnii, Strain Seligo" /NCGR_SAMPLE_ID=MMETSP0323_2 /ASSEMBLY_ACC=CAM_ASM_000346 /LENGTH=103 /DNA_ID=CAMNT_0039664345 /DNA_START=199 /DNA_END=510 /DNA_ORIENTATION=+